MTRFYDREKAVALRMQGLSYSQIKDVLGISKSTLSGWLSHIPLSKKKIKELKDCNQRKIERFRNTMNRKRETRLLQVFKNIKERVGKLNRREIFIAGLALYWGEGGKVNRNMVTFTNTNYKMIKFILRWFSICFRVKKEKIVCILHLYSDMDVPKIIQFWSDELGLLKGQFKKPYIKRSSLSGLTYKSGFGKGTCTVRVYSRDITEKIMMGLKCLENLP